MQTRYTLINIIIGLLQTTANNNRLEIRSRVPSGTPLLLLSFWLLLFHTKQQMSSGLVLVIDKHHFRLMSSTAHTILAYCVGPKLQNSLVCVKWTVWHLLFCGGNVTNFWYYSYLSMGTRKNFYFWVYFEKSVNLVTFNTFSDAIIQHLTFEW